MKKAGQYQIIISNDVEMSMQSLIKWGNFSKAKYRKSTTEIRKNRMYFSMLMDTISPVSWHQLFRQSSDCNDQSTSYITSNDPVVHRVQKVFL